MFQASILPVLGGFESQSGFESYLIIDWHEVLEIE
jgi:hypothetical protein